MNTSPAMLLGLVTGALLISASPVRAQVIEQRQELKNEFTVECSWNSNDASNSQPCKVTGSQQASQHQSIGTTQSGNGHVDTSRWSSETTWNDRWNEEEDRDGRVKLRWNYDDGTCHIRYSEATARNYKYSTTASCDQGEVEIGGLVPGKAYRFQVRDDDSGWSRARRLIAR